MTTPSQNKVLFLVPDGVGVRNYLYTSLISEIKKQATISIWTTLEKEAIDEVSSIHNEYIAYTKISLPLEPAKSKLYREAAKYARLKRGATLYENPTILSSNWNFNPSTIKLKLFNALTRLLGANISNEPSTIVAFEKRAQQAYSNTVISHYKKQLEIEKPDTIFITHQRVFALMPICIAAKELGIKIVSCIYSWDNPPKASLGIIADRYVVWSTLMKKQLIDLYPEIPQEHIVVTGTPQFEFYSNKNTIIPRSEFANKYDLDLQKKWICFSGDDVKTSPYDPQFLEDVAQAIEKEKLEVQIVFRRCPVDYTDRYDNVLQKYKHIIKAVAPIWVSNTDNWGAIFPKKEDISLLVNVAYHSELVVNLGSTMAHDFAVFDKPCFYFKYNPVADKNWSVEWVYNFEHFKSMQDLKAVGWFTNKQEIGPLLKKALQNPEIIGPDRKKWMQRIVHHPLTEASKNIAAQLIN